MNNFYFYKEKTNFFLSLIFININNKKSKKNYFLIQIILLFKIFILFVRAYIYILYKFKKLYICIIKF